MARGGLSDYETGGQASTEAVFMFLKINHYIFLKNENRFTFSTLKSTIQYNIEFIYFIFKTVKYGGIFP